MKKLILLMMVCVTAGFSMTSCKDDGLSLDDQWIAMATVENPAHDDLFFFVTDGGSRMWTAVRTYNSVPKDGDRILVNYTLLTNKEEGSGYDHDVRINGYRKVLRKDAAEIESADDVVNDPIIGFHKVWVGGGFINFDVSFAGDYKTHVVNLYKNDGGDYEEDGKLHLEFRHDSQNDGEFYRYRALASFDPTTIMEDGDAEVDIVIHYWVHPAIGDTDPVERTRELTYSRATQEPASSYLEGLPEGEIE